MMYKYVSFDIGGTLLETVSNSKYNLDELTKLIGLPRNKVRKVYKDIFQKRKGSLLELVTMFCNQLDIEVTDEIMDFFKEKYSLENNKSVMNPMVIDVINRIRDMGYGIILLSNSCCLVDNGIDDMVMKNIDRVFYSYDLGYTKSDSEIYRLVEEELGVKSNEILHIGDNFNSDYVKPRENGWDSLYYGNIDDDMVDKILSLDCVVDILWGIKYGKKGFNKRRTD